MKAGQSESKEPILCTIKSFVLKSNVWVNVTFSNTTSSAVAVWNRNLLKDTVLTWVAFEVCLDGKRVDYIGKEIKRLAPGSNEFYKMEPGEICTATVDLGRYYDLSRVGVYQVRYSAVNPPENRAHMFVMESPKIDIAVNPAR
jgi:hypothetical protein